MQTISPVLLALACALIAGAADAGTRNLSNTAHHVVIDEGTVLDLPNGGQVTVGVRTHAAVIDANGEHFSQWCTASGAPAS